MQKIRRGGKLAEKQTKRKEQKTNADMKSSANKDQMRHKRLLSCMER